MNEVHPVSLRAYARHRGCALKSVQQAISSGRLAKCVTFDRAGRPKISDLGLADAEWKATTLADRRPITSGASDASPARAVEVFWRAKLAELKFKRQASELVDAAEVEAAIARCFSHCRARLLRIPEQAAQAGLHPAVVKTLRTLILEASEELTGRGGK